MKKRNHKYFSETDVKSMAIRDAIDLIKDRMHVLKLELDHIKQRSENLEIGK